MLRRTAWSSLLLCVICSLATGLVWAAEVRSVAYEGRRVLGVAVHVITVNLNDPHIKVSVATAEGFPRAHEPFGPFVSRIAPSAAVTGTYFHSSSFYPVGDIVVDGRARHRGRVGTTMGITPYNEVTFAPLSRDGRAHCAAYETVLGAGPRLLVDGEVRVDARREGFRDPHVLGRAPRMAVGVTEHNKLLLVALRRAVTLTELAKIMRAMGCVQAMNLDGGSSSAMYFDGRALVSPGRPLVNLLVVHENVPLLARTVPPLSSEVRSERQLWLASKAAEHFAAGERLARRGAHTAAVRHYDAAAYLAGNNASYHAALGMGLEAQGKPKAAAKAYGASGHILVRKQQYRRALASLANALALNPLEVSAYDDLAIAYGHVYADEQDAPSASEGMGFVQTWPDGIRQAEQQTTARVSWAAAGRSAAVGGGERAGNLEAGGPQPPRPRVSAAASNELYVHVTTEADELLRRERTAV